MIPHSCHVPLVDQLLQFRVGQVCADDVRRSVDVVINSAAMLQHDHLQLQGGGLRGRKQTTGTYSGMFILI
jgi:hypothetical protein